MHQVKISQVQNRHAGYSLVVLMSVMLAVVFIE